MNGRERVTRAIQFNNPDRVPIWHGILPASLFEHGQALMDLLTEFPDDFGFFRDGKLPDRETLYGPYKQGRHTDEWNCVWDNEHDGMLGICVGHPLEDWSNWSEFKFPEIPSEESILQAHGGPDAESDVYRFGFGMNIFERMQFLRGYETLMCDLALKSEEAYILRDAIVEWSVENAKRWMKTGVDGQHYSDDWGTQISLIISPNTWREFFKPAYAKMFEPAKAAGKHIHFHSDGFTWEILHDLIEVGVDVLNVQHVVMDIKAIAKEFGGKVAFRSDLDRQHILPHGTRQEIRDHVKEVVECLGSYGGGLIGNGECGPDVPLENVRTMLEAWHEFGKY